MPRWLRPMATAEPPEEAEQEGLQQQDRCLTRNHRRRVRFLCLRRRVHRGEEREDGVGVDTTTLTPTFVLTGEMAMEAESVETRKETIDGMTDT